MSSSVQDHLINRIARFGPITFSEFMETALYSHGQGYYSNIKYHDQSPDFFTSPTAHPAFGSLLSLQLEEMWNLMEMPPVFTIVEVGAGNRLLANDILQYIKNLNPRFQKAIKYYCIDRSRKDYFSNRDQPTQLDFPNNVIHWIESEHLPLNKLVGCILSNELLDAMPVHRVTVHKGHLKELLVGYEDGKFVEIISDPSTKELNARLEKEEIHLKERQLAEICLSLEPWMKNISEALERGFVLTIDYGHPAKLLYSPTKPYGTIRCYYNHTLSQNPYERVGLQDITAHVDFTAVMTLGKQYGLKNDGFESQANFMNHLGLTTLIRGLRNLNIEQRERDANRMGMLELSRMGGLGEFRVLVQSKGINKRNITGFEGPSETWSDRLKTLPIPLLNKEHLNLMQARYPHTAWSWEYNPFK